MACIITACDEFVDAVFTEFRGCFGVGAHDVLDASGRPQRRQGGVGEVELYEDITRKERGLSFKQLPCMAHRAQPVGQEAGDTLFGQVKRGLEVFGAFRSKGVPVHHKSSESIQWVLQLKPTATGAFMNSFLTQFDGRRLLARMLWSEQQGGWSGMVGDDRLELPTLSV